MIFWELGEHRLCASSLFSFSLVSASSSTFISRSLSLRFRHPSTPTLVDLPSRLPVRTVSFSRSVAIFPARVGRRYNRGERRQPWTRLWRVLPFPCRRRSAYKSLPSRLFSKRKASRIRLAPVWSTCFPPVSPFLFLSLSERGRATMQRVERVRVRQRGFVRMAWPWCRLFRAWFHYYSCDDGL